MAGRSEPRQISRHGVSPGTDAHAFANAIAGSEQNQIDRPQREIVIVVPLSRDASVRGDSSCRAHLFRSAWFELGQGLRTFRSRYGLTQDEVAPAIGATDGSAVGAWEHGVSIPDGVRRQNVIDLFGRRAMARIAGRVG
jgi:DNA-binding XRE family transcriptional regulator